MLEIACGTGIWTEALARRAQSVVATDVSQEVIDIARTKQYSNNNVKFKIADAFDLAKLDGSFDVIFAADWFSHIPKSLVPEFLRGVNAHLRKPGSVILLDMAIKEFFVQEEVSYDDEGNRISVRILPDGSKFRVVKNFPTESDMKDAVKAFTADIRFCEDNDLQRWLAICTITS